MVEHLCTWLRAVIGRRAKAALRQHPLFWLFVVVLIALTPLMYVLPGDDAGFNTATSDGRVRAAPPMRPVAVLRDAAASILRGHRAHEHDDNLDSVVRSLALRVPLPAGTLLTRVMNGFVGDKWTGVDPLDQQEVYCWLQLVGSRGPCPIESECPDATEAHRVPCVARCLVNAVQSHRLDSLPPLESLCDLRSVLMPLRRTLPASRPILGSHTRRVSYQKESHILCGRVHRVDIGIPESLFLSSRGEGTPWKPIDSIPLPPSWHDLFPTAAGVPRSPRPAAGWLVPEPDSSVFEAMSLYERALFLFPKQWADEAVVPPRHRNNSLVDVHDSLAAEYAANLRLRVDAPLHSAHLPDAVKASVAMYFQLSPRRRYEHGLDLRVAVAFAAGALPVYADGTKLVVPFLHSKCDGCVRSVEKTVMSRIHTLKGVVITPRGGMSINWKEFDWQQYWLLREEALHTARRRMTTKASVANIMYMTNNEAVSKVFLHVSPKHDPCGVLAHAIVHGLLEFGIEVVIVRDDSNVGCKTQPAVVSLYGFNLGDEVACRDSFRISFSTLQSHLRLLSEGVVESSVELFLATTLDDFVAQGAAWQDVAAARRGARDHNRSEFDFLGNTSAIVYGGSLPLDAAPFRRLCGKVFKSMLYDAQGLPAGPNILQIRSTTLRTSRFDWTLMAERRSGAATCTKDAAPSTAASAIVLPKRSEETMVDAFLRALQRAKVDDPLLQDCGWRTAEELATEELRSDDTKAAPMGMLTMCRLKSIGDAKIALRRHVERLWKSVPTTPQSSAQFRMAQYNVPRSETDVVDIGVPTTDRDSSRGGDAPPAHREARKESPIESDSSSGLPSETPGINETDSDLKPQEEVSLPFQSVINETRDEQQHSKSISLAENASIATLASDHQQPFHNAATAAPSGTSTNAASSLPSTTAPQPTSTSPRLPEVSEPLSVPTASSTGARGAQWRGMMWRRVKTAAPALLPSLVDATASTGAPPSATEPPTRAPPTEPAVRRSAFRWNFAAKTANAPPRSTEMEPLRSVAPTAAEATKPIAEEHTSSPATPASSDTNIKSPHGAPATGTPHRGQISLKRLFRSKSSRDTKP